MFFLEVRALDGSVSQRPLANDAHLSIGRHATSDIQIDEPEVAVMHCRIGWNRSGFEIVSAAPDGVDVNGTLVRKAFLRSGDLIRVGSLDLVFRDSTEATSPESDAAPGSAQSGLAAEPFDPDDIPLKSDPDAVGYNLQSSSSPPPLAESPPPKKSKPPVVSRDYDYSESELEIADDEEPLELQSLVRRGADIKSSPPPPRPAAEGIFQPQRPSDIDPLKSPLVLGLTAGAVALVLTALTLWFVIGRQTAERDYKAAVVAMEQRKFAMAEELFVVFLKTYPQNSYAPAARNALDISRVERWISGSSPDWQKGLESLEQLVRASAARPEETTLRTAAHRFAEQIALGAAHAAGRTRERGLLDVSRGASRLLQITAPDQKPAEATLEKIINAVELAEVALRRDETFTTGLAEIDAALTANQPLVALTARRRLLDRYREVRIDREVIRRTLAILDAEKAAVQSVPDPRLALTDDRPETSLSTLTLLRHTQARSDLVLGQSQTVTVAGDTCFGLDRLTGSPLWQRVIGLDTPFSPRPVSTSILAVLTFDTRYRELLLLRRSSGELIWRLPLDDLPAGRPLEHAGQLFLTTRGGKLHQIEIESGKLLSTLHFSQPLATPPVLLDGGERLVLAGKQGLLYVLSLRPLACEQVVLSDHVAGAITAPLLPIADLLLIAENDGLNESRVSLWSTMTGEKPWSMLASVRLRGQVHDAPAIRGKQLLVPTTQQRVTVLTVADTRDERALTTLASFEVPSPHQGPLYVATGPDDEWWMAGDAFRRFKLTGKTIKLLPGEFPLGTSQQPPQFIENESYLAASWPYSSATFFFAVNRMQMAGLWQVVLGAPVLEMVSHDSDSILVVTETGDVHAIPVSRLYTSGFLEKPIAQCTLPDGLSDPIRATALDEQLLTVDVAGAKPQLWVLRPEALGEKPFPLSAALEAPPARLGDGVLLPLPGRIRLADLITGKPIAEDFLVPISGESTSRWQALVTLDDRQFLALTADGKISKMQFRLEPQPHLFEVAQLSLDLPLELSPVSLGEFLAVASGSNLVWLVPDTLEIQARLPHSERITAVHAGAGACFVSLANGKILNYSSPPVSSPVWEHSLGPSSLAGSPVRWKDDWLLACRDGRVLMVSPADGTLVRELSLGQPIAFGPRQVDGITVVGTLDGALHALNRWLDLEVSP